MAEKIKITKGTKLFRAQLSQKIPRPKICRDTHKTGIYFGNSSYHAFAAVTEHNTPMFVTEYELQKTFTCLVGKYSHRRKSYVLPCENISHIDGSTYPIVDICHWQNFFGFFVPDDWTEESCYEIFISSNDWYTGIVTKLREVLVSVDTAKRVLLQCTSYQDDLLYKVSL